MPSILVVPNASSMSPTRANLAVLARGYFDRFCSAEKSFQVVTLSDLVRQVIGSDLPASSEPKSKQAFLRDLSPYSRTLGTWANIQSALYDEMYAHLIGDALPVAISRFSASTHPRVSDKGYRERRTRYLGPTAVASLLEAAARLEKLASSSSPTAISRSCHSHGAPSKSCVRPMSLPNFSSSIASLSMSVKISRRWRQCSSCS